VLKGTISSSREGAQVDAAAIAPRLDAARWRWCRHIATRRPARSSIWRGRTSEKRRRVAQGEKLLLYTDRLPTNEKARCGELTRAKPKRSRRKPRSAPERSPSSTPCAPSVAASRAPRNHAQLRGALLLDYYRTGVGTMITADAVEKLRPARIEDVAAARADRALEADGSW